MTETQWLESRDAGEMLGWLNRLPQATPSRKFRAFVMACVRGIERYEIMFRHKSCREILDIVAEYTSGKNTSKKMRGATRAACDQHEWHNQPFSQCVLMTTYLNSYNAALAVCRQVNAMILAIAERKQEVAPFAAQWVSEIQPTLLRDIVGNPFTAFSGDIGKGIPQIRELAQAAYDSQRDSDIVNDFGLGYGEADPPDPYISANEIDPARLLVLSDALEDLAECDNEAVLKHLRLPGKHVRGCWVLDLILSGQ